MFSEKWKNRAEVLKLWTEIIGIVGAGIFTYYQFIYKEIRAPKSAPVNVSVDLVAEQLEPMHLSRDMRSKPLIPIRVRVGARNPSTREVELFPAMIVIYGEILSNQDESFERDRAESRFDSPTAKIHERYAIRSRREIVAFGNALTDKGLKPNESIGRTFVVHIPPGRYDRLEALMVLPAAKRTNNLIVDYKVNTNDQFIDMPILEIRNGKKYPLKRDSSTGEYIAPGRELQQAVGRFQLSLPDDKQVPLHAPVPMRR